MTENVWYIAYGSNLFAERFAMYLQQSRDTAPPSASRPHRINHPVVFAGASNRWDGGGVAFLDVDSEAAPASYGRAWRISRSQFEDVFRQENKAETVSPLDLSIIAPHTSKAVLDSWYGRVHRFADIDGEPAVTFTRQQRPDPLNHAAPSYLRVIAGGLAEAWDFDQRDAAHYLHRCPGLASGYSLDQLHDSLGGEIEL